MRDALLRTKSNLPFLCLKLTYDWLEWYAINGHFRMNVLHNEAVRDEEEMDHYNVQLHDLDYYYYYYYYYCYEYNVFLRQMSAEILTILTELIPLTVIIKSVNKAKAIPVAGRGGP
jgi:hypothetical protein